MNILIWGLFALGFNLLYGYRGPAVVRPCGAVSASAAMCCGIAIVHFGWPWYVAIAVRHRVRLAVGLRHRLSGDPHARHLLLDGDAGARGNASITSSTNGRAWTGGENGLRGINVPTINLFGFEARLPGSGEQVLRDLRRRRDRAVVLFAHPCLAVRRRLEAIRENERARRAPAATTSPTRSCWRSCCRAPFAAWPARCAHCTCRSCRSKCCSISTSGDVVMMALLGGLGTFFGPFIGAAVFQLLATCSRCGPRTGSCSRRDVHRVRAVLPARHLGLDPALVGSMT